MGSRIQPDTPHIPSPRPESSTRARTPPCCCRPSCTRTRRRKPCSCPRFRPRSTHLGTPAPPPPWSADSRSPESTPGRTKHPRSSKSRRDTHKTRRLVCWGSSSRGGTTCSWWLGRRRRCPGCTRPASRPRRSRRTLGSTRCSWRRRPGCSSPGGRLAPASRLKDSSCQPCTCFILCLPPRGLVVWVHRVFVGPKVYKEAYMNTKTSSGRQGSVGSEMKGKEVFPFSTYHVCLWLKLLRAGPNQTKGVGSAGTTPSGDLKRL